MNEVIAISVAISALFMWGFIGYFMERKWGGDEFRGFLFVSWPIIILLLILFSPFLFGWWLSEVIYEKIEQRRIYK